MKLPRTVYIVSIAIFFCATSIVAASSSSGHGQHLDRHKKKKKKKIALITLALPWLFGPYQSQMHQLSLLLNDSKADADGDEIEYDIYWSSLSQPTPMGVYDTYNELRPHVRTTVRPPADFPLDHITFLGIPKEMGGTLSVGKLNALQHEYGFDCVITLMDIGKMAPSDEALNVPVLAWVPLHSKTVSTTSVDYWILRMYHGVAGLAPSGAKAIEDAVGEKMEFDGVAKGSPATATTLRNMFGRTQVDFIPHIFDRKAISASADVGLELLKDHSVAEADSKLTTSPLVNRGQESTLEPGHSRSLFGEGRKDDFVVLLQGGNYDKEDRKGWDTSFQAYARFYESLDDPSGVHLLIHSMESYIIASEKHMDADAPAAAMPVGVMHRLALHELGLPSEAYTIDIARHAPEVVAAYKKRADVCLHPSKVEGFGMNVMECQIVGTPVVTTNYTAMGDFTKLGRSVPHRQTIRNPEWLYEMALPDVGGIADAIGDLYQEHMALKRGDEESLMRRDTEVAEFNEWIDSTCSPAAVGKKFKSLLLRSYSEFAERLASKQVLLRNGPPTSGAYAIVSGYHTPIVDWDTPWTLFAPDGLKIVDPTMLNSLAWMMHLNIDGGGQPAPTVLVLPAKYENGRDVPVMNADNSIHEDLPILVRTYMVTAFQQQMSRRKSLVQSAIQNAQQTGTARQLLDGLAIIKKGQQNKSARHYNTNMGEL